MQTDYGTSLLSALLALAITAALSYLLLRLLPSLGSTRWFARFAGRARLMEIEDMLRIDGKSTLVIVRVEGRRLLLASHTGAAPALIGELRPSSAQADARVSTATEAGDAQ